jgi:hypothetical protein
MVLSLGLGLGLGLGLAVVAPLPRASAAATRSGRVPTIYHKSRSFRIPFNVDPADRPRLKEVQLWVSDDSGFSWKTVSRTTPDRPAFTFRAARDAEYWFAVRTLDIKGNLFPAAEEKVEPSMKVIVDTTPPSILLEPDGRRGSLAAVRWEVRDEHLDLKSLVLEYQVEGGRDWRVVPIRRPALIGSESWDAGTAEPLKVRASVSDRAGNVQDAMVSLSEGTPTNPSLATGDPADLPNPAQVAPISSGPTATLPDDPSAPRRSPAATVALPSGDPFASSTLPASAPQAPAPLTTGGSPFGPESDPFGGPAAAAAPGFPASAAPAPVPVPAPAPAPAVAPGAAARAPAAGPDGPSQTILVPSPRFPLQYAVEDAGPTGPATVELWVTQDSGRTWFRRGEDPDRTSPFPVDLGGEGTFGLRLVARGASGLGDQPPAPGDPPHIWVEVDSTAPDVKLAPVVVGHGANLGKVAIQWRAGDVHLADKPVVISWRPVDQSGARWIPITEQPIENSGKFIWTVPTTVPPKFHVRVDVIDTAGNRGSAETSEDAPVIVDRARPRSRIIGLDPSARNATGPSARPLR